MLAAVRGGRSERAFKALYDRHTPYLWRIGLRLCAGDADRAQEVVASAWIRAASRLDGFEGRSALRTWLAGFVVNVHRELSRAQGRTVGLDEDRDLEYAGELEETVLARVDLDRALDRLPDGFRRVLVLHDVEGFTHEEIGEMLGVMPGTSKSQLSRARRRVRALLTEQNHGSS